MFDPALHPVGVEAPSTDAGRPSARPRRWILPPHDDPSADSTIRAFAGGGGLETEDTDDAETLVAPTAGFADRRAWKEAFRREQQRLARYDCPVTVVVAEIGGLDSLAAVIGLGAADRLLAPGFRLAQPAEDGAARDLGAAQPGLGVFEAPGQPAVGHKARFRALAGADGDAGAAG